MADSHKHGKCPDCPWVRGDIYQRDCCYPECPAGTREEVKPPVDEVRSPIPAYECPHCGREISDYFGAIAAHVLCCEGLHREAK
jgi:hypothetical protein